MSTTPEVPATSHWPLTILTSSMWTSSGVPRLENDDGVLRERLEGRVVVEREGRHDDAHADLEAALDLQLRVAAVARSRGRGRSA